MKFPPLIHPSVYSSLPVYVLPESTLYNIVLSDEMIKEHYEKGKRKKQK